jgi:hypothetical protein
MDWLFLLLLLAVGLAVFVSGRRRRAATEAALAADLAAVRRAVDEDVTVFGEQLQSVDAEVPLSLSDPDTHADHRRALDAYDAAKESAAAMRQPDDARYVSEILEDGRYALACVRARAAGEPLPTRRPPCFFDPRHGPSLTDVQWAPAGGMPRDVPACGPDAERVKVGAEPHSRQVLVGPQRVPYWQAGPAFSPMTMGYFGAFGIAQSLFLGTMMGSMLGGGFGDGFGGDYEGDGGGGDAGDGGGGDVGGGDAGGGDFGGGDFGGGFGDFGDF